MAESEFNIADFIADLSDQAIIGCTKDGHVVFYNQSAKRLMDGISYNKSLEEVISGDELSVLRHNLAITFYQQTSTDFYWLYKKRLYSISTHIFASIAFLYLRDITEVRVQSDLLRFCSRRFNQIEKLSKTGYWELNIPRKIFYWSDGMYDLFNINDKAKSYQYNIFRRFIHPEDLELYKQSLRRLLSDGQPISGNIRINDANNITKTCRFAAIRSIIDGEDNACGVLQDITDYCSSAQLMAMAELGHSIKQHVQAIKLFNDSQHLDYRLKINQHINAINNILKYSADNAQNNLALVFKPIKLADFLSEICREFQEIAQAKDLKLICRINPTTIISNNHLLQLVLSNLLDNACKFAKNKVVLGNSKDSIWVVDDGCGISPEEQSKIFSCFYHGSNSQGWGMGLSIVCDAIKKLGFSILLKSRQGQYSAFRIRFSKKRILAKFQK